MDVLVTCPSQRDRKALAGIGGYTFHLLDAPLNPRTPSPELNILEYLAQCREYTKTHHIDAIFYSRDAADLVAAALCEEFGRIARVEDRVNMVGDRKSTRLNSSH